MVLLIASCNGGRDYPLDIEFRVEGTEHLAFCGSYGDTIGHTQANGIVPASYYVVVDEHEIAGCFFVKHTDANENDTLIVSLYADGELYDTEMTTTYNTIELFYPEQP